LRGWRREWDSNPRYACTYTRFPSVRLKPLGHLSGAPVLTRRKPPRKPIADGPGKLPSPSCQVKSNPFRLHRTVVLPPVCVTGPNVTPGAGQRSRVYACRNAEISLLGTGSPLLVDLLYCQRRSPRRPWRLRVRGSRCTDCRPGLDAVTSVIIRDCVAHDRSAGGVIPGQGVQPAPPSHNVASKPAHSDPIARLSQASSPGGRSGDWRLHCLGLSLPAEPQAHHPDQGRHPRILHRC
jgi:hypothetical protein